MDPWICPRCGTVWAGWVAKCTCSVPTMAATDYVPACAHPRRSHTTAGLICQDCGMLLPLLPPPIVTCGDY